MPGEQIGPDSAHTALERALRTLSDAVVSTGAGSTAPLAGVRDALEVRRLADLLLAAAVDTARADGATWAQVGEVLGTSRQAAFQRFGRPVDPRTGELMNDSVLEGAGELAAQVFVDLSAADWAAVHARFDDAMARGLPPEQLADTWAQMIGTVGAFEGQGEPFARRLGPWTAVDIPLHFEAGDLVGRVSYRDDRRIAGLYLLAPDAADRK